MQSQKDFKSQMESWHAMNDEISEQLAKEVRQNAELKQLQAEMKAEMIGSKNELVHLSYYIHMSIIGHSLVKSSIEVHRDLPHHKNLEQHLLQMRELKVAKSGEEAVRIEHEKTVQDRSQLLQKVPRHAQQVTMLGQDFIENRSKSWSMISCSQNFAKKVNMCQLRSFIS